MMSRSYKKPDLTWLASARLINQAMQKTAIEFFWRKPDIEGIALRHGNNFLIEMQSVMIFLRKFLRNLKTNFLHSNEIVASLG